MAKKCPKHCRGGVTRKFRDWAADPKMWLILAIGSGVATAVVSAYLTKALNLKAQTLRNQLEANGIQPEA